MFRIHILGFEVGGEKPAPTVTPPAPKPLTPEELTAKALEDDIRRSVQELAEASNELSMARREEQAAAKRKEAAAIRARIKGP